MNSILKHRKQNFYAGNRISNILDQIANNIILFDKELLQSNNTTACATTNCTNITGLYDCQLNNIGKVREQPHSTFLIKVAGDSMINAGINDGDIMVVDSNTQAVNNSIIVGEINNTMCVRRIKFINENFVLFAENRKYPPIIVSKKDNFIIWGVVRTKIDVM